MGKPTVEDNGPPEEEDRRRRPRGPKYPIESSPLIALDRLMAGRTVIAIAHRLSTLRSFDRIVVLQAGRVAEDGSPGGLVRGDGIYRDLVRREMSRLELEKQAA